MACQVSRTCTASQGSYGTTHTRSESFYQQIGKAGRCGCCFCQGWKLNNIVKLLRLCRFIHRLLGFPFLVRNKLACLRIALEGVGPYVLPGLETYAPVESFDEGGLIPGMSMGSSTSAAVFGSFLEPGSLSLILPISALGSLRVRYLPVATAPRRPRRRLRFLELEAKTKLVLAIEVAQVVRCLKRKTIIKNPKNIKFIK